MWQSKYMDEVLQCTRKTIAKLNENRHKIAQCGGKVVQISQSSNSPNSRPLFHFSLFFYNITFSVFMYFSRAFKQTRSRNKNISTKHTKDLWKIEQPVGAKIAILMGRFLFESCCRKAVSKFHKDQRWFPNENFKENTKKTLKNSHGWRQKNSAISCRGRENAVFCAVTAENKRVPKIFLRTFWWTNHTVCPYFSVPS